METVIALSPNHNTVLPSSAVNLGLRLAPQAGVHHLHKSYEQQTTDIDRGETLLELCKWRMCRTQRPSSTSPPRSTSSA